MHSDIDIHLLDAWRAGDTDAGNQLFDRYFSDLYRFFRNKVSDGVEDLVQNTLLGCVERRDQFRGQSSFRTYLYAVARFQLFAHFRRRNSAADPLTQSVADCADSPRTHLARRERREIVQRALQHIPIDYQIAIELAYWGGLKGPELAQVLGIPANTVRSRLSRARQALRQAIEREVSTGRDHAGDVGGLDALAS